MKCKLLCKLKGLLGIYTPGCEYWVDLKDIDIPIDFLRRHPRHEKMEQKWNYYKQTGEFESPILLNRILNWLTGIRHISLLRRRIYIKCLYISWIR